MEALFRTSATPPEYRLAAAVALLVSIGEGAPDAPILDDAADEIHRSETEAASRFENPVHVKQGEGISEIPHLLVLLPESHGR
ncbi:hypothetical protein KHC28_03545 [Ancylobacter sonchi]|uniref:hypothetical protein n=1 Tax=Ancylobacter sonchi TaxID=1937790 RepID=UPI001BD5412E|nr:hypothetical protein [Ancylobacter sonchi]MBS7532724.1 hypothetical protein [Ancylobacter sonchi]